MLQNVESEREGGRERERERERESDRERESLLGKYTIAKKSECGRSHDVQMCWGADGRGPKNTTLPRENRRR